jgi:phage shock protein E
VQVETEADKQQHFSLDLEFTAKTKVLGWILIIHYNQKNKNMSFLHKLFGIKQTNFAELVKQGATIVDVRTNNEFKQGHIRGAINIPLQSINTQSTKLKKEHTIITCCASGMRSASAKSILKAAGFTQVHNGGGWMSLQQKIK